jgi:tetraacyldisaccharide 4'-kinase
VTRQQPDRSAAATLQQAWLRRGPLACTLWPVSLAYRALVALRAFLYCTGVLRRQRLPVPVIVVGNVVAGGAGKTPAVMALVEHLRSRGIGAGVVSRGYGRSAGAGEDAVTEVLPGSAPEAVGDEPLLIRRRTGAPVFVGRCRAAAASRLLAAHPGVRVIICDDGLQHLALERDIEVCVFDDRGAGNGWLLPAGPLREPWPRRVDAVLHTGGRPAFAGGFSAARSLGDFALRADGSRMALDSLAGVACTAVAGIAQPEAFFAMLRSRGLLLDNTQALPDHHGFADWPLPADPARPVLCTEKDAAKLWQRWPGALAVPLAFVPEPAFFATIDCLLDARLSST